MSTMVVELYEALKDAGASDEKAKAAAVAMANFDSRFNHIDATLAQLDKKLEGEMAKVGLEIAKLDKKIEGEMAKVGLEIAKLDKKIEGEIGKLDTRLSVVEAEIRLTRWFTGVILGGMIALVLKAFWPH